MRIRINLDNGSVVVAWNRCADCSHEWRDKTTGFARFLTCPECGSEYWKWLSYGGEDRQATTESDS